MRPGSVALVGAGPGHADFLTLGALRAIGEAEVILYDALIGPSIRDYFPQRAHLQFVGKRCGQHSLKQTEINQQLIHHATRGRKVVRLKGGDPLVFGRGAEEIEALRRAGIAYKVIPGISSLNGIAALHALPLTARTHSNEFRAIQGHTLPSEPTYWHELATYQGTLIIYMGLENLQLIVERLRTFGADRQRAIAIIETDEHGDSHVTRSELGALQRFGFEKKTSGPGIIYIGANVTLMDTPTAQQSHHLHAESSYEYAIADLH